MGVLGESTQAGGHRCLWPPASLVTESSSEWPFVAFVVRAWEWILDISSGSDFCNKDVS